MSSPSDDDKIEDRRVPWIYLLIVILGMILVSGLLLGHQPGNAAKNIVMTGGE